MALFHMSKTFQVSFLAKFALNFATQVDFLVLVSSLIILSLFLT